MGMPQCPVCYSPLEVRDVTPCYICGGWPESVARFDPAAAFTEYRLPNGQLLTLGDEPANRWYQDQRVVVYHRYYYEPRERVYVVFGSSVIAALDYDGKVVWRRPIEPRNFDVAISPFGGCV